MDVLGFCPFSINPIQFDFPWAVRLCGLLCLEETTAELVCCDVFLWVTAMTTQFLLLARKKKKKKKTAVYNNMEPYKDYRLSSRLLLVLRSPGRSPRFTILGEMFAYVTIF